MWNSGPTTHIPTAWFSHGVHRFTSTASAAVDSARPVFPWNPQPVDGATRHGAALQQHSWWLRKLSTAFALPAQPGAGEVMEQYRLRAQRAGWDVQTPPSDREAVMSNATTTVKVVVNLNDQGMYVMTVGPRHQ